MVIGQSCIISKDVYIDQGVRIGNNVKIQNGVSVYHGVTIEDGVFVGPHVCFTNDKYPRAINPDGSLKRGSDWQVSGTLVRYGAALGARSVVLPGIVIGEWAMTAAGAVVTHDVPPYGLVVGHPARLVGFVCPCGWRLERVGEGRTALGWHWNNACISRCLRNAFRRQACSPGDVVHTRCVQCGTEVDIPASAFASSGEPIRDAQGRHVRTDWRKVR